MTELARGKLVNALMEIKSYLGWRVCPDHGDMHHVEGHVMRAVNKIIDDAIADQVNQSSLVAFADQLWMCNKCGALYHDRGNLCHGEVLRVK